MNNLALFYATQGDIHKAHFLFVKAQQIYHRPFSCCNQGWNSGGFSEKEQDYTRKWSPG
jgi:hypothetical protein